MQIDQLITKILEETFTSNKLKVRVPLLKEYLAAAFFGSVEEFKKSRTGAEMTWLEALGNDFYQSFNKDNLYQIFGQIEAYIDTIKPLVVYLPIIIPNTELVELGKKLRSQYGQNFLFELKFDPNLIAGCAMVWNGVYKDYSLRSSIEAKKEQILASFKSFITK